MLLVSFAVYLVTSLLIGHFQVSAGPLPGNALHRYELLESTPVEGGFIQSYGYSDYQPDESGHNLNTSIAACGENNIVCGTGETTLLNEALGWIYFLDYLREIKWSKVVEGTRAICLAKRYNGRGHICIKWGKSVSALFKGNLVTAAQKIMDKCCKETYHCHTGYSTSTLLMATCTTQCISRFEDDFCE